MSTDSNSALGLGLSCTYCAVALPMPDGSTQTVVAIQPSFGIGTNPVSGKPIPDVVSGRALLAEAIVRRISTERGTLPDSKTPTTVGNYGIDVLDSVDADMTAAEAGLLASSIDAQLRQEERITSSTTTATLAGDILVINIAANDGAGPFKLTLTIDALNRNLSVLSSPQ